MSREEMINLLSKHRSELRRAGVRSLACFGSVARNEARADSDIDFLVEFTGTPDFARYMDLKFYLEDLLGKPVDLVTRKALRPQLRAHVEREAVHVPGL